MAPIAARMRLLGGNSADLMRAWDGEAPQVVYLDPSNPEALIQLGVLAERRGDAAMSARYRARAAGGRT